MAVKFEYSVNMQESFHVFLGLAIGKSEALMELLIKKMTLEFNREGWTHPKFR
jgi:hypothetical protein